MPLLRSPAERYIKALLLDPENYSTSRIIRKLDRQELDPIGPDYIDNLRSKLKPPPIFYPGDGRHFETVKFLRKEEVYSFFHPDYYAKAAWDMLRDPAVKIRIEALALAGMPYVTIAAALRREGRLVEDEAVSAYLWAYWDLNRFDVIQIRTLLYMRFEDACGRSSSADVRAQAKHVKKASYLDPRMAAALLPNNKLNGLLLAHLLGIDIGPFNQSEALQEIIGLSVLRTYEEVCKGGVQGATSASLYANVIRTLKDVLAGNIDATAIITKELSTVRLKQEKKAVPMIGELTQGNHTADTAVLDPDKKEK